MGKVGVMSSGFSLHLFNHNLLPDIYSSLCGCLSTPVFRWSHYHIYYSIVVFPHTTNNIIKPARQNKQTAEWQSLSVPSSLHNINQATNHWETCFQGHFKWCSPVWPNNLPSWGNTVVPLRQNGMIKAFLCFARGNVSLTLHHFSPVQSCVIGCQKQQRHKSSPLLSVFK